MGCTHDHVAMYPTTHCRVPHLHPACEARGIRGRTCLFGGQEGVCPCPLPRPHAAQPSDETHLPQSLLGAPTCSTSYTFSHLTHEPDRLQTHCCRPCAFGACTHGAQTLRQVSRAAASTTQSRAAGLMHLGPPSTMMKGSMRQLFRVSPLDRLNRRHLDMTPGQHTPCDSANAVQDQSDDHQCCFLHCC